MSPRHLFMLGSLLLIGGCLAVHAGEPDAPESKRTDLDLQNHAPFAEALGKLTDLTVYDGMPRDTKLAGEERRSKKTVKLHGYTFYAEKASIQPQDRTKIVEIGSELASFKALQQKFCGGFHPDYALEWTVGKETWRALICLTCHEIKFYGPKGLRLHCDIEEQAFDQLKTLLAGYRRNR